MKFLILSLLMLSSLFAFAHSLEDHELTDSIFPRTDPKTIGLIYQMLELIDLLFTRHNIPYWIDGGTALGAVRHQGCIPWDDDADLVFHIRDEDRILALKDEFSKYNFYLEKTNIIRLFASKETRYPCVDIAGYRLCRDNTYRFDQMGARLHFWHQFYWLAQEIDTLVKVKFGPLLLSAPNDMMRYIFTGYGADSLIHATFQTHHGGTLNNLKIQQKVRIIDFNPAVYENYYRPWNKALSTK